MLYEAALSRAGATRDDPPRVAAGLGHVQEEDVLGVRPGRPTRRPAAGRRRAARSAAHCQVGGRGPMPWHYVADLVRLHTAPDGTAVRFYLGL